ncbi:DUF5615 family PIN-like protein [candidate division KSB1 bacterium]|nr:DUF5615 family PIN-like protein [candidate division KSB1 bacterium]MBL7093299.1 DUF5615 family PIN-like protein [candidate division KSB1 bacterium]
MKFIVDVCVGVAVSKLLKSMNFDVISVVDIDPHMLDNDILILAVEENRVLITIDKDFGDLVFTKGYAHCGIIRLEDDISSGKVAQMKLLLNRYTPFFENNFIVVKGGKVRIRKFDEQ